MRALSRDPAGRRAGSESARALLARAAPESLPDASWTRPESWHLTLRFLGDVSRGAISRFLAAIAASAAAPRAGEPRRPRAPDLSAARPGARARGGVSRTTAVGVARGARAPRPRRRASAPGLGAERRAFHPHVTFARLRRPWPARGGRAVPRARRMPGPSRPGPCGPASSTRAGSTPAGALHTPIARWCRCRRRRRRSA